MKRILSLIFLIFFFAQNAAFSASQNAEMMQQTAFLSSQNGISAPQSAKIPPQNAKTAPQSVQEQILRKEHLFAEKNAPCDVVVITNLRNIIAKGNVLSIVFDCKFWSEKVKAGERVNFSAPESIYTQEGTLIIPAGSKIVATVIKIEKPKKFNKNARVYLKFECLVLPDGSAIAMSAKPFTKDGTLKEGAWMTAGKLAASTLGLGIIGAGAGVGFSFIPNPAKIGTGLAIGIHVGCSVGLITGLLTPGLKYHAKAGESIKIILCDDLCIKKIGCN